METKEKTNENQGLFEKIINIFSHNWFYTLKRIILFYMARKILAEEWLKGDVE